MLLQELNAVFVLRHQPYVQRSAVLRELHLRVPQQPRRQLNRYGAIVIQCARRNQNSIDNVVAYLLRKERCVRLLCLLCGGRLLYGGDGFVRCPQKRNSVDDGGSVHIGSTFRRMRMFAGFYF